MRTDEGRYEAVASRDARFDGAFYVAVTSTGIYCRPSCPAVTPKRANVRFFPTAAAAHGAGFRACRRCRPDAVPGSAEWNVRADVVGRAMRLIGDGVVDREGVAGLAARLGYSARQLHRHLTAEVGAGPLALARAQRAHTARLLLQATALPATEVAFAAGFASVRQFNDTIRTVYAATPSDLRGPRAVRSASPGRGEDGPAGPGGLVVRLGYRRPYAVGEMFDYLARRALRGAEEVIGDRGRRTYRRTLRLTHGPGIAAVAERPGADDDAGWLECRLSLSDLRDLTAAVSRVRRLFDLDADPRAVAERLGADPVLAPLVARHPGLRAPGATDAHELAVRAVLGQQVSVPAGRRLGETLLAAYGEPLPTPSGGLTLLFTLRRHARRRVPARAGHARGPPGDGARARHRHRRRRRRARRGRRPRRGRTVAADRAGHRPLDRRLHPASRARRPGRASRERRRPAGRTAPPRSRPERRHDRRGGLGAVAVLRGAPPVDHGSAAGRDGRSRRDGPSRGRPAARGAPPGLTMHMRAARMGVRSADMEPMTVYTTLASPVGDLLLVGAESDQALGGLALASLSMPQQRGAPTIAPQWRRAEQPFTEAARQIAEYFAGERRAFTLTLRTRGTEFQEGYGRRWSPSPTAPPSATASSPAGSGPTAVTSAPSVRPSAPIPCCWCARATGSSGPTGHCAGSPRACSARSSCCAMKARWR